MDDLYARLAELESNLGYVFKNKDILLNALAHSSYENEHHPKGGSNERLEFLGDSVLSLITAEYLFEHLEKDEGVLTKIKAKSVCEEALYEYAQTLNLGDYILFGKGEKEVGKNRPSTVSDCFEAVLAAIYLDSDYETAKKFVLPFISNIGKEFSEPFTDYKTILQEIVQKNKGEKMSYRVVDETGPEHNKTFVCQVLLNSNVIGEGSAHSKKHAEQQAAKAALELMGVVD